MSNLQVEQLNELFKGLSLEESLKVLESEFLDQRMVFSSSLGLEDQVITDAIFKKRDSLIEVFTLDTQRLFKETSDLISRTEDKYLKSIKRYLPNEEAVNNYIETVGLNGFYESIDNRKQCCYIRKVEPLNRALQGAKLWITGIRQAQSDFRQNMQLFEYDAERDLIKFNPLLSWTTDELWNYIKQHGVPFNELHLTGYPSIGCEPCTRAIKPEEDQRAGRWWWENQGSTKQECGLHITRTEQ